MVVIYEISVGAYLTANGTLVTYPFWVVEAEVALVIAILISGLVSFIRLMEVLEIEYFDDYYYLKQPMFQFQVVFCLTQVVRVFQSMICHSCYSLSGPSSTPVCQHFSEGTFGLALIIIFNKTNLPVLLLAYAAVTLKSKYFGALDVVMRPGRRSNTVVEF